MSPMQSILQSFIDKQQITTINNKKYIIDEDLVEFILQLDQIKPLWKRYLQQEEKPCTYDELLESNEEFASTIEEVFISIDVLKMYMLVLIRKHLSVFPQSESNISKIVKETQGNLLSFIQTPEFLNQLMKNIISESMKNDTLRRKDQEINFKPLEQALRKLQKTKRDSFVLSNALMYFNWNILNCKIEELVIESFMNSKNNVHLTKTLFFAIKRELDFYDEDLHLEVQKKFEYEFLMVGDILSENNSKWEMVLSFVRDLQKKRTQEKRLALASLNLNNSTSVKKKETKKK